MQDPLQEEAALVAALRLTAGRPRAWIDAAAMLPTTIGELETIERAVNDQAFRERFARDAHGALANAGLEPSDELVSALRSRLPGPRLLPSAVHRASAGRCQRGSTAARAATPERSAAATIE